MSEEFHRTPDWARLRDSGFWKITDSGDRIAVTNTIDIMRFPAIWTRLAGGVLAFLVGVFVAMGQNLAGVAFCFIGIGLAVYGGVLFWMLFGGRAHTVIFQPESVEFLDLFGNHMGGLPREALQQITVARNQSNAIQGFYHSFIADTGWMQAMPCGVEQEAVTRNNILMSAFSQPLHLDGVKPSGAAAAPGITDLRPAV